MDTDNQGPQRDDGDDDVQDGGGRVQRVAIVTGGARGIGAAIAATLAGDGFSIATLDIRDSAVQDKRRMHLITDVSDSAQVTAAVTAVVDRFGRVDALINNAGILDVHAVDDTPEDAWDRVMTVNVKSVYLMSQAVMPHLRAIRGGSIVNITSVHAIATVRRAAAYAASKGAVLALTRQMALDYYDEGIRVNAVVVGSVDTDMSRQHGESLARDGVVLGPPSGQIGRSAQPAEIAGVVRFLCSDEASFITGAPVPADGGLLARLM